MRPIPKNKRYVSNQYLEFIRELPCCVCGDNLVDAHHVASVGSGGSDLTCIPLCRADHTQYHVINKASFENKHGIDVDEIRLELLELYVRQLESLLYGREK